MADLASASYSLGSVRAYLKHEYGLELPRKHALVQQVLSTPGLGDDLCGSLRAADREPRLDPDHPDCAEIRHQTLRRRQKTECVNVSVRVRVGEACLVRRRHVVTNHVKHMYIIMRSATRS